MSAYDENPPGPGETTTAPAAPRRLLDDPDAAADPAASWALGLLRGAEPYRAPAGRKQRVQLMLGHTPRRRAPLTLRLAVMACVLFGFAAIVSAALGRWPGWAARAYERVVGKPPAARPAARARARAVRHDPPPAIEPAAADVAPEAVAAPAPIAAPERPAARDAIPASPASPRRIRTVAVSPQPAAEDASVVAAAMRALRVERNPARARSLLARYLGQHPNGSLAEEALAMSIEAALAHHDADATALAARYLRLYPQGSFQGLARQALAAAHPSAGNTAATDVAQQRSQQTGAAPVDSRAP